MRNIENPLRPGTVIRTHPKRGYWGCAVVLSARDSTPDSYPMSHIATTTLVRPRKYSWKSIDISKLEIANLTDDVRITPNEYVQSPKIKMCIGIYSLKNIKGLDIIGHLDPMLLYPSPLTFEVGDGSSGKFPLCGPIPESLGYEAVVIWRRINDTVRFEKDKLKRREQFESMEKKRLEANRVKLKNRKGT